MNSQDNSEDKHVIKRLRAELSICEHLNNILQQQLIAARVQVMDYSNHSIDLTKQLRMNREAVDNLTKERDGLQQKLELLSKHTNQEIDEEEIISQMPKKAPKGKKE